MEPSFLQAKYSPLTISRSPSRNSICLHRATVLLYPACPPSLPPRRPLHPCPLLCLVPLPQNFNLPQEVPIPHKQVPPTVQPQARPQSRVDPAPTSSHPPLDFSTQTRPRRRRRQSRPQSARRHRRGIHRGLGNVSRGFLGRWRTIASPRTGTNSTGGPAAERPTSRGSTRLRASKDCLRHDRDQEKEEAECQWKCQQRQNIEHGQWQSQGEGHKEEEKENRRAGGRSAVIEKFPIPVLNTRPIPSLQILQVQQFGGFWSYCKRIHRHTSQGKINAFSPIL